MASGGRRGARKKKRKWEWQKELKSGMLVLVYWTVLVSRKVNELEKKLSTVRQLQSP